MSTVEIEKKIKELMDKGISRDSAKIILGITEEDK